MASASAEFRGRFAVEGVSFQFAANLEEAVPFITAAVSPALILLDIRFEGRGDRHGLSVLRKLRADWPELPVVMMSGRREPAILVESWELGARSYLVKWAHNPDFHSELAQRISQFALQQSDDLLLGSSEPMRRLRSLIATVAEFDTTVLIRGETGTGKELVAEVLHRSSPRSPGPLIKVNCAALPDHLVESELFGYQKGAFTGAASDHRGKVEVAEGGVLFLDEIGEIKPELQSKLLRFLDRKEFSRIGEARTRTVDVQIVAATNIDLNEAVKTGQFRLDLLQRLKAFVIETPALRDCRGDIPLLAGHFLERLKRRRPKPVRGFSPEALDALVRYSWPGNVRELAGAVERAYILTSAADIGAETLPPEVGNGLAGAPEPPGSGLDSDLDTYLARAAWGKIRGLFLAEVASDARGAHRRVAAKLGLNPANGLARRLAQIKRACPELEDEIEQVFSQRATARSMQSRTRSSCTLTHR